MKVTIEHDGKKVDVELTAEQVKELGLQEEKKTGWERVEYGKYYYYFGGSLRKACSDTDINASTDIDRYNNGSYFTDEKLAEKMLKRVRLMLKMQRWADEHNEPLDWNDKNGKYCIIYDTTTYKFVVDYNTHVKIVGTIYFSSFDIAIKAIEEFGNEIIECYGESEVTR